MNPEADVALVSDLGLSCVQAHPDANLGAVRPIVLGKSALSSNGSCQSRVRAGEREEERIALRVDLATLAISHRLPQDPAVDIEDLAVPVAELPQKPGRALAALNRGGENATQRTQSWSRHAPVNPLDPDSQQYL